MRRAYLTVFLSLTITILLSLLIALLQGARRGAVEMETECVTDIATQAALSEYSRAALERYDLLLLDASYGKKTPSLANVEERLRYYGERNFAASSFTFWRSPRTMTAISLDKVAVPSYRLLTDEDYGVLKEQILAYMEAEPLEGLLSELTALEGAIASAGLEGRNVEVEIEETREETGDLLSEVEEDKEADNPADKIWNEDRTSLLDSLYPEAISGVSVEPSDYPSHRKLHRGSGWRKDKEGRSSLMDTPLLLQYLSEKCSYLGKEEKGAVLHYQLEYLLTGGGNDHENLTAVGYRLLLLREAANILYLESSTSQRRQAEEAAMVLAFLCGNPELEEVFTQGILLAWALAESACDLYALFHGKQVPLFKDADSFHLKSLLQAVSYKAHYQSAGGEEGLSYLRYLQVFLLMLPEKERLARLSDLIEMDIRNTAGNTAFRLDFCIDAMVVELETRSGFGISAKGVRRAGYQTY